MNSPFRSPDPIPDAGWRDEAACQGQPQEYWFSGDDADEEIGVGERRRLAAYAKRVCRGCPVQAACLDAALRDNEPFGIWGGLNPRERGRLRRQRAAVQVSMPSHGTERDYLQHLKLDSVPCAECRKAHARHIAARRERRKVAAGVG